MNSRPVVMQLKAFDSEFLDYLVERQIAPGERLPTLEEISRVLGVSVGKLREQLEVARHLGIVSVRPRVGIRREPFDFAQVILPGVLFSLGTGETAFSQFSQLRRAIEKDLWHEAVVLLDEEDKSSLKDTVDQAWLKLRKEPIHVPNGEHRRLHLKIFSRLENPFVYGLLEAYWDAYEASELTRYASYQYWLDVWEYHEKIVDALLDNDFERGRQLLVKHFALLPSVEIVS